MCLTSEFSKFNEFNFGFFHKTEENFVNCWSNCLHLTKSTTLIEKSSLFILLIPVITTVFNFSQSLLLHLVLTASFLVFVKLCAEKTPPPNMIKFSAHFYFGSLVLNPKTSRKLNRKKRDQLKER